MNITGTCVNRSLFLTDVLCLPTAGIDEGFEELGLLR